MKTYTAEEVAAHNKDGDCWLIIENKIYDVSTFIDEHPVPTRRFSDLNIIPKT